MRNPRVGRGFGVEDFEAAAQTAVVADPRAVAEMRESGTDFGDIGCGDLVSALRAAERDESLGWLVVGGVSGKGRSAEELRDRAYAGRSAFDVAVSLCPLMKSCAACLVANDLRSRVPELVTMSACQS